ncbi:lipase family alpha/beta hydrolase [Nocardia sp. NPDC059246]|uniref:lipase family alpha/beta hydrolase n=1 Tax=unclassified Nocardia TaxID=2637762 RepID=UPI0036CB9715
MYVSVDGENGARMRWFGAFSAALVMFTAASGFASTVPSLASTAEGQLNDWACQPDTPDQYPVVLVHGIADSTDAWDLLNEQLTDRGYCTYALNYGKDGRTFDAVNGFGPLEQSGDQLTAFVDRVLRSTGSPKVDIVAHSEGGVLAEYYAKTLGGASKIHAEILLAPDTHGTTMNGLVSFANATGLRPQTDVAMTAAVCPACADLEENSSFMVELGTGPIAAPGVTYAVLATRDDTVVTPAGEASFIDEPGVVNEFVQDLCPYAHVEHGYFPQDAVARQWILSQLSSATPAQVTCQ